MKISAAIAQGAWLAASIPAWRRFHRALDHPRETQEALLLRMVRANMDCAFGRAHKFGKIRRYEEFRDHIEPSNADDLEPCVAQIRRGERDVLTSGVVTRLVPTSGTISGRKLIPFTAALQREFNAAIAPWIVELYRTHPEAALGPAYWSISPAIASAAEESAVAIGFEEDSAYLGGLRRYLARATFAVPPAISRVHDVELNRYLSLLHLLRHRDLRLISIWHPSFLTLLLDLLPRWWDELLHDLEIGSSARGDALRPELRHLAKLRPNKGRVRELRQLDSKHARALWPHLCIVSCWSDAQAAVPAADLRRRLPGVFFQPKGLLATEAVVSIPWRESHPVAITSHFYEFIDEHGRILCSHELEVGCRYGVMVTTSGGLWRYRLGDMVEVDGFVGATPSLRFLGRGSSNSDLCGEKLEEIFVTRVLERACSSFRSAPRFAMLAPEVDSTGKGHYTFFCEGAEPGEVLAKLEAELRANPHYALCRDLGQLGPLQAFAIPGSGYAKFCDLALSAGQRSGDIKPQSLSTRTDWRKRFNE